MRLDCARTTRGGRRECGGAWLKTEATDRAFGPKAEMSRSGMRCLACLNWEQSVGGLQSGVRGQVLSLTIPGHVSPERTEVAMGATLLNAPAEGTQEPDERIAGPRKGHDLEEHCFVG
jgi:hypothetical protein